MESRYTCINLLGLSGTWSHISPFSKDRCLGTSSHIMSRFFVNFFAHDKDKHLIVNVGRTAEITCYKTLKP